MNSRHATTPDMTATATAKRKENGKLLIRPRTICPLRWSSCVKNATSRERLANGAAWIRGRGCAPEGADHDGS